MKKILLLLTLVFSYGLLNAQSTCGTATQVSPAEDEECVFNAYAFTDGSPEYWFQFTAGSAEHQVILKSNNGLNPVYFGTVELYANSCTALQLIESITVNAAADTIVFDSLLVGELYRMKITNLGSPTGTFDACFTEKANSSFWTNRFTTNSGHVLLNCMTTHNAVYSPTMGNQGCNEVTICVNENLQLEIIAPIDISNVFPDPSPCPHLFAFINQNGASVTYSPNASASLLTTLSFTQTGTVTFFLVPNYYATQFPNQYNNFMAHPSQYMFTVHVVNQTPAAVWANDVMCTNGSVVLSSPDLSTFSNVTVDGVAVASGGTSIQFNGSNYGPGTHTVNYTVTGACGVASYTTTFTVQQENGAHVTIGSCGNVTFSYTSCPPPSGPTMNVTFSFGDGTPDVVVPLVNGSAVTTHHYTTTTPVTWNVLVEYYNGIDYYEENGTFNGVTAQPLTITADGFLCELVNPITINPAGMSNINWTITPTHAFTGQGTATITPTGIWAVTADVTVSVTAQNASGCLFSGQKVIKACCGPKGGLSATEYFEKSYYVHSNIAGLSQLIPSNVSYYAPTSVAISLPSPPSGVVNTPHGQPITLASLITTAGWTVTSNTLTIPQVLYINNDLIISQNITLINSNFIRIAPGKRIIVNPGVVFKVQSCTFAPKCNEMWGGIVATASSASITLELCNVVGATNGVYVQNSADLDILSCVFVDNYIGVKVDTDSQGTGNRIRNTYFGDVPNVPLLFPYNTQLIPEAGVVLSRVVNMTVGTNATYNASDAGTKGNLFHNMKRGVDANRSAFRVYRSSFYNMAHAPGQPAPNDGDMYCGIRAQSVLASSYLLTAGSTATDQNIFMYCDYAISARRWMNLDARYNYIRGIRIRGINFEDNVARSGTILNNQVNSENPNTFGIYAKNYTNGTVLIQNNLVNTNMGTQTNLLARMASGIYAANVNPNMTQSTTIKANTVNNGLYAIWIININNATIDGNTVTMNYSDAIINSLATSYAPIRGIILENGTGNKILNNTVTRYSGNGNGVANDRLQGIRIELSPSSTVWKNTMTSTAVGFYAKGSNLGSKVQCNSMVTTNNGFYMSAADISFQGQPVNAAYPNGLSAHNIWSSNFMNNTAGTTIGHTASSPLYYYHANGTGLASGPATAIVLPPHYWNDMTLAGTPATTCGSTQTLQPIDLTTPADTRTFEMGAIVLGDTLYDTLDVDMKHYLHQSVLMRLEQDASLVTMNAPDDALYQNYLNTMQSSETEKINQSRKTIAQGNYAAAALLIAQLDGSDPRVDLIKTVQEIWNDARVNDTVISPQDSTTLREIACMNPMTNGSAVYQARAILDYDGWCGLMQSGTRSEAAPMMTEATTTTQVFPNPSNGSFTVTSGVNMVRTELYDLNGALLKTNDVQHTEFEASFQLKAGIYLLKITLTNGTVETHKIDIQ